MVGSVWCFSRKLFGACFGIMAPVALGASHDGRGESLFFDVFGTLVDWRTSIARETEALLKPLGFTLDWPAFADAWRGEYQGAMDEVRSGRIPFRKLDILHRRNLELILPRFHVGTLSEEQRRELNLAWHR